jgi:hypothetical protein
VCLRSRHMTIGDRRRVEYLKSFPNDAIAAFCASAEAMIVPSPSQHPIFRQGGAIARGPAEFPIPWRDAPWAVHPFGLWENQADDERGQRWAHGVREAALGARRCLLQFHRRRRRSRPRHRGVGKENYSRLQRVKRDTIRRTFSDSITTSLRHSQGRDTSLKNASRHTRSRMWRLKKAA